MGLGDFISKYVVEIPTKPANQAATTNTAATATTTPVQMQTDTSGNGIIDKKYIDHFEVLIKKNNKPGPDAFEFMNYINGLTDLGLTELQIYKAAWKQFKNMDGADVKTVESVASDFDDYIKAVDNDERENFGAQVATIKGPDGKLGKLYAQRDEINNSVVSLQTQIESLKQQIQEKNSGLSQVTEQIMVEETKLNANVKNYAATKAAVITNLTAMVQKMRQYLTA
jgi:hypothetical protein